MRSLLGFLGCCFGLLLSTSAGFAQPAIGTAERHPNIVFFLVDDLGWADLGCNGSTYYETPNIDALAASGMRFTQAYAACPVCSPTRASILTGRHPVRVDITDWIPGLDSSRIADRRFEHVDDRDNLALDEITLAETLRDQASYQTFFLGKWHLGDQGHWPTDQGFDVNIGGNSKGSPPGGYYAPWNNPTLQANQPDEYVTTRLTDEAVQLIERSAADRDRPFFLMFSYYNVHTPITPDRRTIERFRTAAAATFDGPTPTVAERSGISRLRQDDPEYASMVHAVDISVGRVLEALDRAGQSDHTVVVFFSDNGGLCTVRNDSGGPTSNLPLRSGKGWLYEGGIREPMIVRAPGVTEPGTTSDALAFSTDFCPTLLELAGLPSQPALHVDGVSLVPQLQGAPLSERAMYWHYPHYHGSTWRPGAAVRDGNWKLIEFYEENQAELYDLAQDPGETHDLATEQPEIRDRLRAQLADWQAEMKAKMPVARRSDR